MGDLLEDLEKLKDTVTDQKSDLAALKLENDELNATVDELKSENAELSKELSFLRNPPSYHLCVYQSGTHAKSSVMTFEKQLYMECNFCDDADFNLNTGVYTNGWPGTYTVSWNSWVGAYHGHSTTRIFLRKNGQNINEARQYSRFDTDNGRMLEQGGRTMLIRMDAGDTLSLYCEDCSDYVADITFCISLFTFDAI